MEKCSVAASADDVGHPKWHVGFQRCLESQAYTLG